MPQRDANHEAVKQALIKDGWRITDDPLTLPFDNYTLFVDLGAQAQVVFDVPSPVIGLQRNEQVIAVEIKDFTSKSIITEIERAIGQYMLYRIVLRRTNREHELYLAITAKLYDNFFTRPLGEAIIEDISLKLIVVYPKTKEVIRWIR